MRQPTKCKLCRTAREHANGIRTTIGWFCYACVRRFRRETAALEERSMAEVNADVDGQE